ncbi:MAG: DUF4149 domain-containing protein [Gemmatimonadaceae bacterium]|nr:DUF4149 domain-containing protein [Gemmatimonadaceae bacterium]
MSERTTDALRLRSGWSTPVAASLLSAWLGAALYFTVVVTRAAFAVLPSRTVAGALVGQTLPVLFDTGMVVGVILVIVARIAMSGVVRSTSLTGGVAILALSALARFAILTRIEALRASVPTPIDSLAIADPARRTFGELHALSVGALGLAMLTGIVVAVVLAHSLSVASHD